jgi:hypothetical protein
MGSKLKEKLNENPGPGSYNANPERIKAGTAAAKIGTDKRRGLLSNSRSTDKIPGPGNYNAGNDFGKNG